MSAPTSRLSTPEWSLSTRTMMRSESTWSTMPSRLQSTTAPESRAVTRSMPVPTSGASPRMSGTAWRCLLEPMSARLASSFSRNGIKLAATETSCFVAALEHEVAGLAAVDELGGDLQAFIERNVGLRHDVFVFFPSRQIEAVRFDGDLAALQLFVEFFDAISFYDFAGFE